MGPEVDGTSSLEGLSEPEIAETIVRSGRVSHRISAPLHERQVQNRLLYVRRQVQQIHDLHEARMTGLADSTLGSNGSWTNRLAFGVWVTARSLYDCLYNDSQPNRAQRNRNAPLHLHEQEPSEKGWYVCKDLH